MRRPMNDERRDVRSPQSPSSPRQELLIAVLLLMGGLALPAVRYWAVRRNPEASVALAVALVAAWAAVMWLRRPGAWASSLIAKAERRSLIWAVVALWVLGQAGYAVRFRDHRGYDEIRHLGAVRVLTHEGPATFFHSYADLPWLGNQHPPLIPLCVGGLWSAFGESIYVARLPGVLCGAGTVLLTFLLGKRLWNARTGLIAASTLGTMQLFFRHAVVAELDVPLTCLFTLAMLCFARALTGGRLGYYAGTGAAVGVGLLIKYPMVLAALVMTVATVWARRVWEQVRRPGPYVAVLVGAVIVAPWVVALLCTEWGQQVLAGQGEMVPAFGVKSLSGALRAILERFVRLFPWAVGAYNLVLCLVGAVGAFRERALRDKLVLSWAGGVMLVVLARWPNHRYFMPAFPALAVLTARGILAFDEEASGRWFGICLVFSVMILVFYAYVGWTPLSG